MARRLTFGPILILLLLGIMWLDERLTTVQLPDSLHLLADAKGFAQPGLLLLILGLIAAARGGFELARLFRAMHIEASPRSLSIAAAVGLLAGSLAIGTHAPVALQPHAGAIVASAGILAILFAMLAYVRHQELKGAATAVAATGFAFLYIGLALSFLMAVRREHSVWAMVAVVFIVKACDSGAYFTGTAIGRHKLIPFISPGKTWEGLVGGLITSALAGAGFVALNRAFDGVYAPARLTLGDGALLGLVLGFVGQAGDLSASVLKRDAGVKDAGKILPGFGGAIDMLDSLLIAAPIAYWYLLFHT
jgi:phosphatidate cytidylyltransferase